jgi:transposase-like protein
MEHAMPNDDSTKAAALKLLASGQATVADIAALTGNSRQLIAYWALYAGIRATTTRAKYLAKLWKKTLQRQG